jgi:succinoglycan biosynthesis transport protein ExoP
MQKSVPHGSKGSFGFQDVLYVLFKHKWKILIMSALGFAAAATVFVTRKPLYQSQAKIAIKYVLQRGGMDSHESEVEASGRGGDQVVNTELEILRSGDLAKEVAEAIGPDRLLPTVGEAANLNAAAGVVLGGLEVMPASRGSNVVYVTYRNEDPQLAVDVLQEVVKRYFNKHLEIHRSVGAFDSVAQQVDEVRNRLRQTEDELNKLKSNAGIISVNDESMSLALQRDKTKQDLVNAEAERDAQATRVQALERDLATAGQSDATAVASVSAKPILKAEKPVPAPPKPEEVEEYRELATQMERLQQQGFELRNKFAAGNAQVIRNQQEVASLKAKRTAMLAKTPGLAMEAATAASGNEAPNPLLELRKERDVLVAIEARIERYHTHLTELETRIKMLSDVQPQITDLERRKEMEDGEYRLLETNLKKARVDRTLDPSQIPNIPVLQQPSAPQRTFSELSTKIALGLAGAGVLSGLGLAFLLELVIDRRIKRPNEIESRLQLPLMLSIPYVRPKNRGALLIANDRSESGGEGDKPNLPAVRGTHGFHPFPAKTDHFIHPYSEAIRDRIVFNFQVNNMTHKPKLMAVAGLSAGAGTSTIAAGLAKAFSEVNGAKVLLVDLNSEFPDDNPMFGNKPLHSLVGALQAARNTRFKEGSQNLYLASAASRKSDPASAPFGPMHLYELLPHFRASEFDYIIFDMPALAQTSPTIAMAGLMDKVLLVVDGEDTSRETLKWGYSELVKGRADVSCIFNKAKSHAPSWVLGDA